MAGPRPSPHHMCTLCVVEPGAVVADVVTHTVGHAMHCFRGLPRPDVRAGRSPGRVLGRVVVAGLQMACTFGRSDLTAGGAPAPAEASPNVPARTEAIAAARARVLVIATPADADGLIPPLVVGTTGRQVTSLLFEHLAEIGPRLNTMGDAEFRPRLARAWQWAPDSLSIAFYLEPRARWHDGAPVRAEDVRFTLELYRDPRVASPYADALADVDSATVRGPHTVVVWYARRSPEQFHHVVSTLRILPEHLLRNVPRDGLAASGFARSPVGSGPFRFVRHAAGAALELDAYGAHYAGRPGLDRIVWTVTPTPQTAVAQLLSGEADVYEGLQAEHLPDVARRPHLATVRYPGLQYGYLQFNLRAAENGNGRATGERAAGDRMAQPHPLFGDRSLRRALAMALDRPAMVRNVFATLADVSRGPFTRAQHVDTLVPQLPYAPAVASRMLDSLGWRDRDGDGIRDRGGRPLRFTLIVPSSSQARARYAVLVQQQLRQVGADVRVELLEFTAFLDRFAKRRFDAAIGAWALDPSPAELPLMWGGRAAATGLNYGGYVSPAFDAAVDSARAAVTPQAAERHLRRAHGIIVADAPAVWLFEQRPVLAVHRRFHVSEVRPDAWWAGLAAWSLDTQPAVAGRVRAAERGAPGAGGVGSLP